jgi:hypothetical protein
MRALDKGVTGTMGTTPLSGRTVVVSDASKARISNPPARGGQG